MRSAAAETRPLTHFRTPHLTTPFHERTSACNRNHSWVPWAGYMTAGVYDDETMEYFAVRNQAGVYDISPMVKYRISGRDAAAFVDRLQVRSVAKLKPGRVFYTVWCDGEGMVIDDGTVFRLGPDHFRICCQERMLPWLLDSAEGFDVGIEEETEAVAGLSLQGPCAFEVLKRAGLEAAGRLKPFDLADFQMGDLPVMISRTGFTGDLGYELFVEPSRALDLWDRLFEAGRLHGIRPFGNDALNLARIEAGFIMASFDFVNAEHTLRPGRSRSPYEIGLGWMVDFDKGHFNGRRALLAERDGRTSRYTFVGLDIEGNLPAESALLYVKTGVGTWAEAGHVTAAAWSPTLKRNIALASLKRPHGLTRHDTLYAEIYVMRELMWQKLMVKAHIAERPFFNHPRRRATPPGPY